MKFNLFKKNNKKGGFTLVETLVAISILMISIAGPVVFVGNGIQASRYAADQVTAYYLAQDAVEALRYLRDFNRITNVTSGATDWYIYDTDLIGCVGSFCTIDTANVYLSPQDTLSYIASVGSIDQAYLYNGPDGFYTISVNLADRTKFKRVFQYSKISPNEVEVTITVSWTSGVIPRSFQIKENLFYWQ